MRTTFSRYDVMALAGYALLTFIFTWPILNHLTTSLLSSYATDNLEILWKMWWVPEALKRGISPFFAPQLYYPYGYDLSWGELTPLHTFLMMPLTLWLGEYATYNIAIILSYILTGWLTYRLARHWLHDCSRPDLLFAASFYAGAVFTFSVYRIQHIAGGHLNLVHTQWLVLALLGLERWLDSRKLLDAVWLALGISLGALSTWYYAFMLVCLLPVYTLARGVNLRTLLLDRRTWLGVIIISAVFAILCGAFLIPYLQSAGQGETAMPVEQAAFWAASPLDYLVPNPGNPLWGTTVQRLVWPFPIEMPIEFMISVGWVTLLLGIWAWRSTSGTRWRALKWLIIAAFVLSLGPYLHLGRLPLGIPLPVLILREFMPIAGSVRSWGRFSLFVTLGLAILSSAAWVRLLETRTRRTSYITVGIVLAVVLFAAWDGPNSFIPVEPRPVDQWLADQPGDFAVMQYPLEIALSGPSMFATRYYHHPATFATGTFFNQFYTQRHPDLLKFPSDVALDQLKAWDVQYILVMVDAINSTTPFTLADLDSQPRLRYITSLDNQVVYELLS